MARPFRAVGVERFTAAFAVKFEKPQWLGAIEPFEGLSEIYDFTAVTGSNGGKIRIVVAGSTGEYGLLKATVGGSRLAVVKSFEIMGPDEIRNFTIAALGELRDRRRKNKR